MRQSIAAFAHVTRPTADGAAELLVRWNPKWQAFNWVGGHKRPDESFRECLARELYEELGLVEGQGFTIARVPLVRLDYTAWSESAGEATRYLIEVYVVDLLGASAWQQVDADPDNRWLTRAEIAGGRTADGRRVSSTMPLVLGKLPATASLRG